MSCGIACAGAARSFVSRPRKEARHGFTLVELLVVIGIIALLMSILLPTLGRVRRQAQRIKCAANLKQIGNAVYLYANNHRGQLAPWTNLSDVSAGPGPLDYCDPYQRAAPTPPATVGEINVYWGVRYALAGSLPKMTFNCPSETRVNGNDTSTDARYRHYGLNGYGIGLTTAERQSRFNSTTEFSLFRNSGGQWIGQTLTRIRNPASTIFCQDAGEVTIDGNHDTFDDWQQHPVDLQSEWLRHDKAANVLFVDGHVGMLNREEQTDWRWFTGRF
jgi:prepilin-type N-terminal cleavage/methylation domain-containing protein/prepilin-type processing-associated H-X9-DG protein